MRKLIIYLLLFLPLAARAETALIVEPLSGADKQFAVSLIGQIRFADNFMYLFKSSGEELGHTPIAEIGKIVFREMPDEPTSMNNVSANIQVFPNPTSDYLLIKGLEANQTARVFSLDGKLMSTSQTTDSETKIDVSNLQQGNYLLQIGAEIVKFIKK